MGNTPAAAAAYAITAPWPTRDGRWLLPHFGIAHLKHKMLDLLQCDDSPEGVSRAVARWDALELEQAIADVGACGDIVRTAEEWLAHPQGQELSTKPVVEIEKIGDSEPEPFAGGGPALQGVRVLDLTRILAGPVAARTCAEHGADVLMVGAKGVPQSRNFVVDLSHGKRSCHLDLRVPEEAQKLRALVRGADVFSQGYRPGVLGARGLGPAELAAIRPAEWEQVAQSMLGICHDSGAEQPALLPVPACDYLTGYLGAYGILLALARRAVEGGSYHVNVSLCQSGVMLNRRGRVASSAEAVPLTETEARSL